MNTYRAEPTADLEFIFPDSLIWEELDQQDVELPMGMKLVDLCIEYEEKILLIEIKDPSNVRSSKKDRRKFFKRLTNDSVLTEDLTPKARDSYTYVHLMMRDEKPIIYVVLLGIDSPDSPIGPAELGNFKMRLLRNVRKECHIPWKREHIKDCLVLSVDTWNRLFKDFPVQRLSSVMDTGKLSEEA
ncbi:MAG: hypothetical protein AAFN40_16625 [Cyanobacteria bacterium J06560_6]